MGIGWQVLWLACGVATIAAAARAGRSRRAADAARLSGRDFVLRGAVAVRLDRDRVVPGHATGDGSATARGVAGGRCRRAYCGIPERDGRRVAPATARPESGLSRRVGQ